MDLRFGLSRSHGGERILDGARLLTEVLGSVIGSRVRLQVAFDYNDLLRALFAGTVDVAWLAPMALAQAHHQGVHVVGVCERNTRLSYHSALLVRDDAPAHGPAELGEIRAAWVEKSSASGYFFPRLHLQRHGVRFASETFAGTFAQGCALVERGEADVCAMFAHSDQPTPPAGSRLRVLTVTEAIPNDGVVLSPQLTTTMQARLGNALLNLHTSEAGQRAMETLFQAPRLVAPTAAVVAAIVELWKLIAPSTTKATQRS